MVRPIRNMTNGLGLSGIDQKTAQMDKLTEIDIVHGISEDIEMNNEEVLVSKLIVSELTRLKQVPLDPDWTNTCDNVYDMHIDVCKEELTENRSEMEYFSENDSNSNIHADFISKEVTELQKQDISEHDIETKFVDTGQNMMICIKFEHCQSKPFLPAKCTQRLCTPFRKECMTIEHKCMDKTSAMRENSLNQQTQGKSNKVKIDKKHSRKNMKINSCEKPFSCNTCEKQFLYKHYLTIHMRSHSGERPFSCFICNYKFSTKGNLNKHTKTHSGEKPFFCDICHSKFSWKGSLDVHMRTHTGEKPFSCDICKNKFTTKSNLMAHLKKHSGEKPFTCDICEKKYLTKGSLTVHMRNHTGEKPFFCDICKNKFTTKSNLMTHLKKHSSGEKLFTCEMCEKKYLTKGSLTIHMMNHTGEKIFPCDVCDMKYTTKSHLNQHLTTHFTNYST